jgi:aryl-alcohol dehydrogenase-like predicted oxidoreductase
VTCRLTINGVAHTIGVGSRTTLLDVLREHQANLACIIERRSDRTLGKHGPTVSALGLGAMGMSDFYGAADRAESIATMPAALEAGITLIDTGDFYGSGHNEMLIRDALAGGKRDCVLISVKFGALRDPAGGFIGYDASPLAVKNSLAQTLERLGTNHVDIYRPARLDPKVPIEETTRPSRLLSSSASGRVSVMRKPLRIASVVMPLRYIV